MIRSGGWCMFEILDFISHLNRGLSKYMSFFIKFPPHGEALSHHVRIVGWFKRDKCGLKYIIWYSAKRMAANDMHLRDQRNWHWIGFPSKVVLVPLSSQRKLNNTCKVRQQWYGLRSTRCWNITNNISLSNINESCQFPLSSSSFSSLLGSSFAISSNSFLRKLATIPGIDDTLVYPRWYTVKPHDKLPISVWNFVKATNTSCSVYTWPMLANISAVTGRHQMFVGEKTGVSCLGSMSLVIVGPV